MTIYDNAFPPMKRLGFVATVNAIADRTMGLDPRYMHREHLLELQSDGWEIASHSVYHSRPLTKMSLSEADYEFKESARQLRSLGLRINSFTYPYDSRNNALENLSKAYYQDVASGGEVANPFPPPDFYFLKRMGIYHHMSVDYVCNKIKAAEQQNSWLILIFHNISDASSAIAYPPDQFRQILEFLHSQPAEVVTQWEGTQLARAYKTSKAAGMKVVQAQKNQSGDSQAARRTARKKGSP
jgi:peptidoglycan/xylan/chitin deacetylase (PgdA/CDA1 family)